MNPSAQPADVVHPYVEKRLDVHGGAAVIKGTRFPVGSIIRNYQRGKTVDEILFDFPDLSPAQVHDALSYYHDHRKEIERDIAEMADIELAEREHPPTLRPSNESD